MTIDIDHTSLSVADYEAAKRFYAAALAPLRITMLMEFPASMTGDFDIGGFGADGKPFLWLAGGGKTTPHVHLAFRAETRAQVDAFYAAAIAAGATDNGPPGLRPLYHENYYGAFVLDAEGHNIEAVCHTNPMAAVVESAQQARRSSQATGRKQESRARAEASGREEADGKEAGGEETHSSEPEDISGAQTPRRPESAIARQARRAETEDKEMTPRGEERSDRDARRGEERASASDREAKTLSGGCQCGAVRFRVQRLGRASICHCRMCQKQFGSFYGPFVTGIGVTWTRGAPKHFRSSNAAGRGFCADCGTPLTFEIEGTVELAIGALDDPMVAAPTIQVNPNDKLPFVDGIPRLPTRPPEEKAPLDARMRGFVSYQHPDHDTVMWPPVGARHA